MADAHKKEWRHKIICSLLYKEMCIKLLWLENAVLTWGQLLYGNAGYKMCRLISKRNRRTEFKTSHKINKTISLGQRTSDKETYSINVGLLWPGKLKWHVAENGHFWNTTWAYNTEYFMGLCSIALCGCDLKNTSDLTETVQCMNVQRFHTGPLNFYFVLLQMSFLTLYHSRRWMDCVTCLEISSNIFLVATILVAF